MRRSKGICSRSQSAISLEIIRVAQHHFSTKRATRPMGDNPFYKKQYIGKDWLSSGVKVRPRPPTQPQLRKVAHLGPNEWADAWRAPESCAANATPLPCREAGAMTKRTRHSIPHPPALRSRPLPSPAATHPTEQRPLRPPTSGVRRPITLAAGGRVWASAVFPTPAARGGRRGNGRGSTWRPADPPNVLTTWVAQMIVFDFDKTITRTHTGGAVSLPAKATDEFVTVGGPRARAMGVPRMVVGRGWVGGTARAPAPPPSPVLVQGEASCVCAS